MIARTLSRAVVSGGIAAITSTLALAVAAVGEDRSPFQPLNATSHWLNGDRSADRRRFDLRHTGVGLGTHVAATAFWALFFEASMIARPTRDIGVMARRAAAIAALAATVDYTITPKRFTPGWELVLSKRSMALVYAAMAAGFFAARV